MKNKVAPGLGVLAAFLVSALGPAAQAYADSPWLSASSGGHGQAYGHARTTQTGYGQLSGSQGATFGLQATYQNWSTKSDYRGAYGVVTGFHSYLQPYETLWGEYYTRVTAAKTTETSRITSTTSTSAYAGVTFTNAYGGAGSMSIQVKVCADKKWAVDSCSSTWTTTAF